MAVGRRMPARMGSPVRILAQSLPPMPQGLQGSYDQAFVAAGAEQGSRRRRLAIACVMPAEGCRGSYWRERGDRVVAKPGSDGVTVELFDKRGRRHERGKKNSLGSGDAIYTPRAGRGEPGTGIVLRQDGSPATDKIIGQCIYYYRPVHPEIVESGVTTWEAVKAWLTAWDPMGRKDVVRRLLQNRDVLIQPSSDSPLWSRGTNFMMRHIGCGHQLPKNTTWGMGTTTARIMGEAVSAVDSQGEDLACGCKEKLAEEHGGSLAQNMMGDVILIPCRFNKRRGFRIQAKRLELELNGEDFKAFAFKTTFLRTWTED